LGKLIVQTPCIDICKIDNDSRLCLGCWRSIDEIARWSQMSDVERAQVMNALPGREALWSKET